MKLISSPSNDDKCDRKTQKGAQSRPSDYSNFPEIYLSLFPI